MASTYNNNNDNPNHIPLAIPSSLKDILTEFYIIPSKSVNITVNHKYELKTIRVHN